MKTKSLVYLQVLIAFGLWSPEIQAQNTQDQSITSVLWVQRSAEYRALCYQAFNLAELRIREYLAQPTPDKTAVVIFDIDETLLDNSPEEARNILDGKSFTPERWKAWTDEASAAPVPGSVEFCHFIATHDIQPVYLSNRSNTEAVATLLNLQKHNFPYADRNHLYLKSDVSSKEFRRNRIEQQYHVVLLVGDNLSDFDEVFENRTDHFGFQTVDSLKQSFGQHFILLPNPMYGDWTRPLTGDRKSWLVR